MADYVAMARRAAQRNGLDPNIFVRQIRQESGFNPNARSPAGAAGIAQIMPQTAKGWGVDPMDPQAALNAAARNMASYVRKYGGYENALRAYNAGPGAIQASKGYAETNNYVRTILGGRDPGRLSTPRDAEDASVAEVSKHLSYDPATPAASALATLAPRPQRVITAPTAPSYGKPNVAQLPATPTQPRQRLDTGAALEALQALQPTGGSQKTTTTTTATSARQGAEGTSSDSSGVRGSKVLELIFNDGGKGYGIKDGATVDGKSVFSSVWGGHASHVHVAAGPKTVVALGKLAERMGLHVGENPHFGGVDPVHVPGSYHYKGEAIDVSGDKAKMAAFARRVAAYNRSRR